MRESGLVVPDNQQLKALTVFIRGKCPSIDVEVRIYLDGSDTQADRFEEGSDAAGDDALTDTADHSAANQNVLDISLLVRAAKGERDRYAPRSKRSLNFYFNDHTTWKILLREVWLSGRNKPRTCNPRSYRYGGLLSRSRQNLCYHASIINIYDNIASHINGYSAYQCTKKSHLAVSDIN